MGAYSFYVDELVEAIRRMLVGLEEADEKLLYEVYDHHRPATGATDEAAAEAMAGDAVATIVAPVLWRRAVGGTIETGDVTERLGITRQAVAMRVLHHSLLALPGRRSRLYPTWQFGGTDGVWPIVPTILRRWYQAEPEVEPVTIATWATTSVETDNGTVVTPAELIAQGGARDALLLRLLDETISLRTR